MKKKSEEKKQKPVLKIGAVKKSNESVLDLLFTILKGMLTGACDLVPGISGGTILFITGVYERFMFGLKEIGSFSINLMMYVFVKRKKSLKTIISDFKKLDFKFFIPLVLGIMPVFYFGASIILNLIKTYPVQVFSFFVGLILASTYIMYKQSGIRDAQSILSFLVGLILGIILTTLRVSFITQPSYLEIFLLGILALSVTILPGISGSYTLLILGRYEYMLGAVQDITIKWLTVLIFAVGGLIGLLGFSRILSWFLKKYKRNTFAVLTGILLGTISVPINKAVVAINSTTLVWFAIIFFLIGAIFVITIDKSAKAHKK